MNERIKELERQATETVKCGLNGTSTAESFNRKKFAESIVKDCASICAINGQSYKHSFTPAKARLAESTSNHCGLMIKKHFGVEE